MDDDLILLAGLIKAAYCLISVNTGIMHLGAALGARVISLSGPTSLVRWGAVSDRAINLAAKKDCSPCLNLGFEYQCQHGGCMKTIEVGEVIRALETFTERN